jgi:hypothetical protein
MLVVTCCCDMLSGNSTECIDSCTLLHHTLTGYPLSTIFFSTILSGSQLRRLPLATSCAVPPSAAILKARTGSGG